jgi:hypothetical protein
MAAMAKRWIIAGEAKIGRLENDFAHASGEFGWITLGPQQWFCTHISLNMFLLRLCCCLIF